MDPPDLDRIPRPAADACPCLRAAGRPGTLHRRARGRGQPSLPGWSGDAAQQRWPCGAEDDDGHGAGGRGCDPLRCPFRVRARLCGPPGPPTSCSARARRVQPRAAPGAGTSLSARVERVFGAVDRRRGAGPGGASRRAHGRARHSAPTPRRQRPAVDRCQSRLDRAVRHARPESRGGDGARPDRFGHQLGLAVFQRHAGRLRDDQSAR